MATISLSLQILQFAFVKFLQNCLGITSRNILMQNRCRIVEMVLSVSPNFVFLKLLKKQRIEDVQTLLQKN